MYLFLNMLMMIVQLLPLWMKQKAICEYYYYDCSGVTRVEGTNGKISYEARALFFLRKSAIKETSWIKYKCHGNETAPEELSATKSSRIRGVVDSSVPHGFYQSPFDCANSPAKNANALAGSIHRIWVWGERNSGTGIAQTILDQNFILSEKVIGGLPWKHGWMSQQDLSQMQNTLNILLVKDAYSWLHSMHKAPIHAPDHADLPLEVFLLKEWYAEKDIGEIDKHPVTGGRLANIFQVRAAKLYDWKSVASCLPLTYVIKYEDFISNTTKAILDIANTFASKGLRLKNPKVINTSVCVITFGACANKKEKNQTKNKNRSRK